MWERLLDPIKGKCTSTLKSNFQLSLTQCTHILAVDLSGIFQFLALHARNQSSLSYVVTLFPPVTKHVDYMATLFCEWEGNMWPYLSSGLETAYTEPQYLIVSGFQWSTG